MSDSNVQNTLPPARYLTDTMVFHLWSVSPWLRFAGVVTYIGCILITLFGIIVAVVAPFTASLTVKLPAAFGGATGAAIGLVCLGIGILLFFAARFVYGFGAHLHDYILSNFDRELEIALENNLSFWKFQGVILIALLALIPIGIGLAVVVKLTGL
ncbi:hypothetical protein AGMMS50267_06580 [Spirochaetia bacterium]|nr:hypothetical protein AGMMS50267_06480 [Spirochaetia bacterium]GHV88298.1 hypothetical protein AGMMS50267_06580 [Spirochaetia bacterium]